MKKQLLLLWACLACSNLHAQTFSSYLQDGMYVFDDTNKVMLTDIFTTHKSEFGLGTYDAMVSHAEGFLRPEGTSEYNKGSMQANYVQYYKGYEIEGTIMNVTSKCGIVLRAGGKLRTGLSLDVEDTISQEDALDSALAFINPPLGFTWNDPNYEDTMKIVFDSTFSSYPIGKLVIVKKFGNYADTVSNYALCWKFSICWYDTVRVTPASLVPEMIVTDVYVNASTGEIHTIHDDTKHAYGNVQTSYDGYKTGQIQTECGVGCIWYRLQDNNTHITTLKDDGSNGTDPVRQIGNNWVTAPDKDHASAHWAAERAWYYFGSVLNNYRTMETVVVSGRPAWSVLGNAMSRRVPKNTGDFEQISLTLDNYSRAALDVVGHEFTHGVIRSTTASVGKDTSYTEAWAINEGLADIFGLAIETDYNNGSCDWTFGEDLLPNLKRNFNDPVNDIPTVHANSYGTYGYYFDIPYGPSGVMRRWFNHTSQGEWNWPVPYSGVGFSTAKELTYIAMCWYLWQNANYNDARNGTLAVAVDHFGGKCAPVWKAVQRSWYDVGVGSITYCKPLILDGSVVGSVTSVGSVASVSAFPKFGVKNYLSPAEGSIRVLDYDWIIPSGWNGTYNSDQSEFTLDSVIDFNSKYISVIVTYERDHDTLSDTLRTVFHFSDECSEEEAGERSAHNQNTPGIASTQKADDKISIYPNPVSRQLNLTMPDHTAADLAVYNINGQEVFSSRVKGGYNGLVLPVLPSGVYMVKIKNSHLNVVKKIQVQQ